MFSRDGARIAYASTARNGTDRDVWVRDVATGQSRALLTEGGSWAAMDFSPDGRRLLVMKYVSAAESYPGVVDVATGKLELFPVDGGKASFDGFAFAPDGRGVYFISDEPIDGKPQEFSSLRHHDPATGKLTVLSAGIPWDVSGLVIADDGRHLAFTSNEDGISKLHVRTIPDHRPVALPALPVGVIDTGAFSPAAARWRAGRAAKSAGSTRRRSSSRRWCATRPSTPSTGSRARSRRSTTARPTYRRAGSCRW